MIAVASEKTYEEKIKKYLSSYFKWHVKFFANRNTKSGIPDLICNMSGRFMAIEVKGEGGKKSELQERNVQLINQDGGIAFFTWPHQWEDTQSILSYICLNPKVKLSSLRQIYPDIDFGR